MVSNGSLRIGTVARAVALAGPVSLTGCISVKSGGGPLSPEKAVQVYGQPFRTLSAEERCRFEPIEAQLKANPGKDVPFFRFALAGSPWIEGQSASKGVMKAIFTCEFWNAKDRFVDHLATPSDTVLSIPGRTSASPASRSCGGCG